MNDYSAFKATFRAPAGPHDVQPITDDVLEYIESAHAADAVGYDDKSKFSVEWKGAVLKEKIQQVIDNPQGMDPDEDNDDRVDLLGLVDGRDIRVTLRDTGKGWVPWVVHNALPRGSRRK